MESSPDRVFETTARKRSRSRCSSSSDDQFVFKTRARKRSRSNDAAIAGQSGQDNEMSGALGGWEAHLSVFPEKRPIYESQRQHYADWPGLPVPPAQQTSPPPPMPGTFPDDRTPPRQPSPVADEYATPLPVPSQEEKRKMRRAREAAEERLETKRQEKREASRKKKKEKYAGFVPGPQAQAAAERHLEWSNLYHPGPTIWDRLTGLVPPVVTAIKNKIWRLSAQPQEPEKPAALTPNKHEDWQQDATMEDVPEEGINALNYLLPRVDVVNEYPFNGARTLRSPSTTKNGTRKSRKSAIDRKRIGDRYRYSLAPHSTSVRAIKLRLDMVAQADGSRKQRELKPVVDASTEFFHHDLQKKMDYLRRGGLPGYITRPFIDLGGMEGRWKPEVAPEAPIRKLKMPPYYPWRKSKYEDEAQEKEDDNVRSSPYVPSWIRVRDQMSGKKEEKRPTKKGDLKVGINRHVRVKQFEADKAPDDMDISFLESLRQVELEPSKDGSVVSSEIEHAFKEKDEVTAAEADHKEVEAAEIVPSVEPVEEPPKVRLNLRINESWAEKLHAVAKSTNFGNLKQAKVCPGRELTTHDFGTLLPEPFGGDRAAWLNDEIVNEYLKVVVEEEQAKWGYNPKAGIAPPVHAFGSQWWVTVQGSGVEKVKRWSRRPNLTGTKLLDCNLILFPICSGLHWTMLAIRPKDRIIEYLDSLSGSRAPPRKPYDAARAWLQMELGDAYIEVEWSEKYGRSGQQLNGSDCGVFTCINGLSLIRDLDPDDISVHNGMLDARRLIAATLLKGKTDVTVDDSDSGLN